MQKRLEHEILIPVIQEVDIGGKLVSSEGDDVVEPIRMWERFGRGRCDESDRDAFFAVHDDFLERPDLGAGEAVLGEGGVLGWRGGWGAEDRLRPRHHQCLRERWAELLTKTIGIPPRICEGNK